MRWKTISRGGAEHVAILLCGIVLLCALTGSIGAADIRLPKGAGSGGDRSFTLIEATKLGNAAAVARLLADGTSPDAHEDGRTALSWAAELGDSPIARLLLDAGAKETELAQNIAASKGNIGILTLILEKGFRGTETALRNATIRGHREIADALLANGVRGTPELLEIAANNGHGSVGLVLLNRGVSPVSAEALMLALNRRGTDALAERLVEVTPISGLESATCEHRSIECLRPVDTPIFYAAHGTPLTAAASRGNLEMLRKLLERGWPVNTVTSFNTPLGTAVESGQLAAVNLLLDRGALVDINPKYGNASVFAIAIRSGDRSIIRALVTKGGRCIGFGSMMEAAARGSEATGIYLKELVDQGVARRCN